MTEATPVETMILRLTAECGPGKSVSPMDVAHALEPGEGEGEAWRAKLSAVRRAAVRLAVAGRIEMLRKGKPVDPETARGVIRLRAAVG